MARPRCEEVAVNTIHLLPWLSWNYDCRHKRDLVRANTSNGPERLSTKKTLAPTRSRDSRRPHTVPGKTAPQYGKRTWCFVLEIVSRGRQKFCAKKTAVQERNARQASRPGSRVPADKARPKKRAKAAPRPEGAESQPGLKRSTLEKNQKDPDDAPQQGTDEDRKQRHAPAQKGADHPIIFTSPSPSPIFLTHRWYT